jgi:hypothetical protein
MTPEEAAAVLGVAPDAAPHEVERAYRRLARDLHPDRFVGRPDDEVRAASERFLVVMQAHETMLVFSRLRTPQRPTTRPAHETPAGSTAAPPTDAKPSTPPKPRTPASPAASTPAPPAAASDAMVTRFSWPLFLSWALLLIIGAALSLSRGPVYTWVDWWPRLLLLVGFALATALTRRRWVWVATLVLLGLTAIAVVIDTTIVGLLGLGAMLIASLGLAVQSGLVRLPPPP